MIQNESMKISTLKKLSEYLNIHPAMWFSERPVDKLDKVIKGIE